MRKKIKQISDQAPRTIRVGGGGVSSKKSSNQAEPSLFSELTIRALTDEEKTKLRTKTKNLLKKLRSKAPNDKRENELLLRQIIAYLSLEFRKVRNYKFGNFVLTLRIRLLLWIRYENVPREKVLM